MVRDDAGLADGRRRRHRRGRGNLVWLIKRRRATDHIKPCWHPAAQRLSARIRDQKVLTVAVPCLGGWLWTASHSASREYEKRRSTRRGESLFGGACRDRQPRRRVADYHFNGVGASIGLDGRVYANRSAIASKVGNVLGSVATICGVVEGRGGGDRGRLTKKR